MMMKRPCLRLLRDSEGTAAVEFALWVTAFFLVVMGAFDFGGYYLKRGAVNEAVGAAAIASFNDAENVNYGDLQAYVRGIAGDDSIAVSTICNGSAGSCTNFSRTCSCLKNDGSFVAETCGDSCTGAGMTPGSTAGYYLSIRARSSYSPIIFPPGSIAPATILEKATVRLQ